jgi:hypothetical protein
MNRHGKPYTHSDNPHLCDLEQAVDGLMFELERLPPLTWARGLLNWLSRVIN